MKASKFTEAQKAFILKQGEEGTPVAEICRKAGISQATYFNWKKKYGGRRNDGATSQEREELRRLRRENRQLRKERDILAKAAAWFAQSDAMSSRSSSS